MAKLKTKIKEYRENVEMKQSELAELIFNYITYKELKWKNKLPLYM
ncbi:hypothetical protein RBU49_06180 [Clostridium sp. MB40-C1]|nr:hypothetical protein [Clostridium sp. MB40-C1]WMJ81831.1 hypothetical protein RBU49_06180 [Clostridium sp. MB40-C1]